MSSVPQTGRQGNEKDRFVTHSILPINIFKNFTGELPFHALMLTLWV
jgi:hypothetical protein